MNKKKGQVPLNTWVKPQTRGAVKFLSEQLEVSQGGVIDRAVEFFEAHNGGQESGYVPPVVSYVAPEHLNRAPAPVDELRAIVTPQAETGGIGLNPCRHCQREGLIHPKTNPWRACPDCQRSGHFNFADCVKCARAAHAAGLAAQSTSCESERIDFDPDWGA